jgi:hypothetical protein
MILIDNAMTDCVLMEQKTRTPDGEGGSVLAWADGAALRAAITRDASAVARIAEKLGETSSYTITTARTVTLKFHDVVKRLSDGAIFRVTSSGDEGKTPEALTLSIAQVTAEKWSLPT